MDTLEIYHVEWKHVNMKANAPSSELDRYLLSEMCKDAAIGVKLQCSREYWDDKMGSTRATQIHLLSAEERKHLPTNNLNYERCLAKFGVLASQSAQRSLFFKVKHIMDDLKFFRVNKMDIEKSASGIMKALEKREDGWTKNQEVLKKEILKKLIANKGRANDFIDNFLKKCKDHGGASYFF